MSRIPVGVLGCTGIVGQRFVRLLQDHPDFETVLLSASAARAGGTYGEAVAWAIEGEVPQPCRAVRLVEPDPAALLGTGVRVFFSALPAGVAGPIEAALRDAGARVFTNAGDHRRDADVPILIPEVNADHLALAERQARAFGGGFIAAGSNCSTAGLVLALRPLSAFGLETVTVSTYQAISGAGRRGLSAFDIAGNAVPHIRNEEDKMERETRRILGRCRDTGADAGIEASPLEVRASCCRIPVRDGHLESVTLELAKAPSLGDVVAALRDFRGPWPEAERPPTAPETPVVLRDEADRPQPALDLWAGSPERARGMAVTVGRLRLTGRVLRLFLLVHNTVRGAAGACLLNAEFGRRRGLLE